MEPQQPELAHLGQWDSTLHTLSYSTVMDIYLSLTHLTTESLDQDPMDSDAWPDVLALVAQHPTD